MSKFEELIDKSKSYDEHKQDWITPSSDVVFDDKTCELKLKPTLFGEVMPLQLTDWSLQQVCQKVGHINTAYAKDCPPWLRAVNLNHWMSNISKDLMIRGYDGKCRAVLSSQYAPIMNTVVLEKMQIVMGDTSYYMTDYLDPDTFHGKVTVLSKDSKDGNYGCGFYAGNGETGNRSVRIAPYIQRTRCQNSIMFLDWGIEIRHYRTTPAFIMGAIKETIGKAIGLAVEAVDRFVEAEMIEIPNISDVVKGLSEKYGLATPIHDAMIFGTEGKATLAGVINGISYAAQKMNNIEERIDLECLAGAILVDPELLKRKMPVRLHAMEDYIEGDNQQIDMRLE